MNDRSSDPRPDAEMASRLKLGSRRGPWRKRAIFGGIGAVILALILWAIFKPAPPIQYVTQKVTRGNLAITVSATGTLAPRDQVDVGAEVSGRLDTVNVDYNDKVKKGEVLAQINTDQLRAQLAQAEANLATAKATVAQNTETYRRYQALAKHNAVSPEDLDKARADLARAKAAVALAEAQSEQYKTQIGKATIRSPIDGVVLDKLMSAGQTVTAGFQTPLLFTLASDLNEMELDVDIDEADVGEVHAGQTATFTVDAYPARVFKAKLVSVHNAPKTVNGVVTYQGVLMLNNPNGVLKPGMTATAEINASDVRNALLVPNGALRFSPSPQVAMKAPKPPAPQNGVNWGRVWKVSGHAVTPVDLKLGATNGRLTQVLSGDLKAGDTVATDIQKPDAKKEASPQ